MQHPLARNPDADFEQVKTQLLQMPQEEFDQLKEAQRYLDFIQMMRTNGRWNVFLGGLTAWMGFSQLDLGIIHYLQMAIGSLLILQSLSMLFRPSNHAVLRFSGILLITGLWNLSITLSNGFRGLDFLIAGLGFLMLWWAWGMFLVYRRNQNHPLIPANPDQKALCQMVWPALSECQPGIEVVEFIVNSRQWRGLLLDGKAVFVPKGMNSAIFTSQMDSGFATDADLSKSKKIKGVLKMGEVVNWGIFSQTALANWNAWKPVDDLSVTYVTELYQKKKFHLRAIKIAKWFTILFIASMTLLIGILLFMANQYS